MSDFLKSIRNIANANSIQNIRNACLYEKKLILDFNTYKYASDLFLKISCASLDGKFNTTFSVDKDDFNVSTENKNVLGNEFQMIQNWLFTFSRLVGFTWQLNEGIHLQNQVVYITINW